MKAKIWNDKSVERLESRFLRFSWLVGRETWLLWMWWRVLLNCNAMLKPWTWLPFFGFWFSQASCDSCWSCAMQDKVAMAGNSVARHGILPVAIWNGSYMDSHSHWTQELLETHWMQFCFPSGLLWLLLTLRYWQDKTAMNGWMAFWGYGILLLPVEVDPKWTSYSHGWIRCNKLRRRDEFFWLFESPRLPLISVGVLLTRKDGKVQLDGFLRYGILLPVEMDPKWTSHSHLDESDAMNFRDGMSFLNLPGFLFCRRCATDKKRQQGSAGRRFSEVRYPLPL